MVLKGMPKTADSSRTHSSASTLCGEFTVRAMISLKKYLDAAQAGLTINCERDDHELLSLALAAYRSSLAEMGKCSLDACPGLGKELRQGLGKIGEGLSIGASLKEIEATEKSIREQLQAWGGHAALHYRQRAVEVKDILIVMARTADSVGSRDERCAQQINEVTAKLETIADLEDLTQMRASIEKSAAELKTSIGRMVAEGKTAIDELRVEVTNFQTKLEESEKIASCDSLTGLRNRLSVEGQIEARANVALPLCVAIIDIDGFKQVNDDYGHMVGDELLLAFATELKSRCRSTDVVGRWGGDELIILLDCEMSVARGRTDHIQEWVCGNYTVRGKSGPMKLRVDASFGLAEHFEGETMKELLARADAEMYRNKEASRVNSDQSPQ
jgi:diguanylate cyclase (GGDEF)-like protein